VKYLTTTKYELNLAKRRVPYIEKAFYKSKKIKIGKNRFLYVTFYLLKDNDFYQIKPIVVIKIAKKSIRIVLDHPDDFMSLICDFTDFYLDIRKEFLNTYKHITGLSLWEKILDRVSVYPALPAHKEKKQRKKREKVSVTLRHSIIHSDTREKMVVKNSVDNSGKLRVKQ